MIVDSSAIVAILMREPERARFLDVIDQADGGVLSAATYVEVSIVVDRTAEPTLAAALDGFLMDLSLTIEPVTASQALIARQAYRDFGRGSGHPARLNFGDCLSYALAKEKREPLLFKGNDFVHTDIQAAI
jgi:ribonuclease VapC